MKSFDDSWLFKPLFDYEYKSYQVLDFEQFLTRKLDQLRLYPYVDQVDNILTNLEYFESKKEDLKNEFPTELKGIDLEKAQLIREQVAESGKIEELNAIMEFAKKHLSRCSSEAHDLEKQLSKEIQISPIGLVNNNMQGGYLFFKKMRQTRVYAYEFSMVQRTARRYKEIKTVYLDAEATGMITDYTDIKLKYVKSRRARFGINAYLVETNIDIPHFETVLPLVKNHLLGLQAY